MVVRAFLWHGAENEISGIVIAGLQAVQLLGIDRQRANSQDGARRIGAYPHLRSSARWPEPACFLMVHQFLASGVVVLAGAAATVVLTP